MKHFIPALKISIQKLKLLTCSIDKKQKLALYEKHYNVAPQGVLKYLQISESDYGSLKTKIQSELKRDSSKDESDCSSENTDIKAESNEKEVTRSSSLMSRCQLVMSSRTKSLEELPSINSLSNKEGNKTPKFKPRSKNKLISGQKNKSKSDQKDEDDITEFIKDGGIVYSKLIKKEISKFDKLLLEASKKTNNIGGKNIRFYYARADVTIMHKNTRPLISIRTFQECISLKIKLICINAFFDLQAKMFLLISTRYNIDIGHS